MRKIKLAWILPVLLVVIIKVFSLFPAAVEQYYSNGIYRSISKFQRIIFGWIPFSIGDIIYALAIIYLLVGLVRMVRRMIQKKANRDYWLGLAKTTVRVGLWVYILFNILWGLNYNREGIARQLNLELKEVKKEEIAKVMEILVKRVNSYDSLAKLTREKISDHSFLFEGALASYQSLATQSSTMNPAPRSIKPSLFGALGNYLGYTGYYNPFTGEAQVNTQVPLFIQPFTSCHEIGHQLGYAKENEANFAGFLSAKCSTDPLFLYSLYFDLYAYGRPYLRLSDSLYLKKLDSQLVVGVRKDFKELKEFYLSHENPIEAVIDKLYGQFLKANQQPAGKVTYGQVILWLVAYWRENGEL